MSRNYLRVSKREYQKHISEKRKLYTGLKKMTDIVAQAPNFGSNKHIKAVAALIAADANEIYLSWGIDMWEYVKSGEVCDLDEVLTKKESAGDLFDINKIANDLCDEFLRLYKKVSDVKLCNEEFDKIAGLLDNLREHA